MKQLVQNATIVKNSIYLTVPASNFLWSSFLAYCRMTRKRVVDWVDDDIITLV